MRQELACNTPSSSIQHVAAVAAVDAAVAAAASAAAAASIASVVAAAGAAVMPLLQLLLRLQLLLQLQFAAAADPADGSSSEASDSTSSAWIVESYRPRGPWPVLTAMDYDAAALKFCIASDYVDAQAAFEVAVAADRKAKSDCKRHNDRESREGSRNRPAAESPTYIAPGSWYYACLLYTSDAADE